ncbi:MAG: FTR1 family protein [Chloroflexi bacterium]|nr:FTR1 family protein [Chloroflexota bacterium]
MFSSLLLIFREGLEAALITGIIFGALDQLGRQDRRRWVWAAVGLAGALSLALAVVLQAAGAKLEGRAEALFEGTAMLLAVGVLTWMIFWMRYQSRQMRDVLQADVHAAVRGGQNWALFSVTFLAVLREGIEAALFLTAANFASGDGLSTFIGGMIGLAAAVLVGWMIYSSTIRLNLRRFFNVTSVILLFFAAGLFAHGLHEFEEIGWLPALAEQVWNLKPVLDDQSTVGSLLRVLTGYNDDPTLLEVSGYLTYWVGILAFTNWWANRQPVRQAVSA